MPLPSHLTVLNDAVDEALAENSEKKIEKFQLPFFVIFGLEIVDYWMREKIQELNYFELFPEI